MSVLRQWHVHELQCLQLSLLVHSILTMQNLCGPEVNFP